MRLHLFEFEDQSWMPSRLRDAMTLYLASVYKRTRLPSLWAEKIAAAMKLTAETRIVDLGSGAAGPMPLVAAELRKLGCSFQLTLTDLYPNRRVMALPNDIQYWPDPVDAREVPPGLPGLRTMFSSFHHFKPGDARKILAGAARERSAICIFEATSRNAPTIASAVLIPLFVLFLTPTIRPLSVLQLVFTYLIPVLPLLIFWDGLVSHLRTYSPDELTGMTRDIDAPGYRWTVGTIPLPGLPRGLPLLIGSPVPRE
jgi:hypothetical protein